MPKDKKKKTKGKVRTLKGMTVGGPRVNKDKLGNSATQQECTDCHTFDLNDKIPKKARF